MPSTIQLQLKIGDLIQETLDKWSDKKYKVTIESFRRTKDCLVLVMIGKWDEENYFFKCTISIKPHNRQFFTTSKPFSYLHNF